MSLGNLGYCEKYLEDSNLVYYSYNGCHWNAPKVSRQLNKAVEGIFAIDKQFVKLLIKSNDRSVFENNSPIYCAISIVSAGIEKGTVWVDTECANAYSTTGSNGIDLIAWHLMWKVIDDYLKSCAKTKDFIIATEQLRRKRKSISLQKLRLPYAEYGTKLSDSYRFLDDGEYPERASWVN